MTNPMTPARLKSIKDHYKMAKREGASLCYTMVGDCVAEIERLKALVKSAHREGFSATEGFAAYDANDYFWEHSEARKAVEAK